MGSSKKYGYDAESWEAGKVAIKAIFDCLNYLAKSEPANAYKLLKHHSDKDSPAGKLILDDNSRALLNEPMQGIVDLIKAERSQLCGNRYTNTLVPH